MINRLPKRRIAKKIVLFIVILIIFFLAILYGLTTFFDKYTFKFHSPIAINLFTPVKLVKREIISPLVIMKSEVKETNLTLSDKELDAWIGECADKFANKDKTASFLRYQLHCLANKETGHKATYKCGDGGLSCGIFQFKNDTWLGFRQQMIKEGLISEISSRDDDKQAVLTTAWALSKNRDMNWGPYVRGECQ